MLWTQYACAAAYCLTSRPLPRCVQSRATHLALLRGCSTGGPRYGPSEAKPQSPHLLRMPDRVLRGLVRAFEDFVRGGGGGGGGGYQFRPARTEGYLYV